MRAKNCGNATMETATSVASEEPPRLREFLLYFLRLGTFGLRGPITLAGYMQKGLVDERKWVSSQDYVEGLANRVTLEPTGILSLEVWNYCPERLRRAWRDNERAKLEEYLPACIAGMMKIALAARSRRDAEEKKEQIEK